MAPGSIIGVLLIPMSSENQRAVCPAFFRAVTVPKGDAIHYRGGVVPSVTLRALRACYASDGSQFVFVSVLRIVIFVLEKMGASIV